MTRTQISLTEAQRRVLDAASARSGRSISSLIRQAVDAVYGEEGSVEDDRKAMGRAFGSWHGREQTGQEWVDQVRSGSRLSASR